jgi:hypothetical protein
VTDRDLLETYMNDHLAGATVGVELVQRTLESNRGTPYEEPLQNLAEEIAQDRETLKALMARLDLSESKLKVAGGWTAEKLGRLKPNNRLTGYSPLSRLIELEGLWGGVSVKLSLWQVLGACADAETELDREELNALEQRGRAQLEVLERLRIDAGREALVAQPAAAS